MSFSEQELVRRESLQKLIDLGIDPYPAEEFIVSHTSTEVRERFCDETAEHFKKVSLAGRIMLKRIMGKASFVELQDANGRIQLYVRRDDICPEEDKTLYNTIFKKLLDLGDFIGVEGYVFFTKTGEVSLHVESLKVLSKSLKPLPIVREKDGETYDAFSNPEQRYRMRYVDLVVNPEVRQTFQKRAQIIQSLRDTMNDSGYLEVDTPVLQPVYGGAAARPFVTQHNTLNMDLYLRISNELYLKRLIVGGFEGVFEFSRNFRNEGMDRSHNPEFTAMELYVSYKDYDWMMTYTENMVEKVVKQVHGKTGITFGGQEIDFKTPWKRISMIDAIKEYAGLDISDMDEKEIFNQARAMGVDVDETMGKGKLIDEIFGDKVEHLLINPTFITDYPVEMSPLAKKHRSKEGLVERFEVICNGMEICNAYSELNDPVDQRQRFEDQLKLRDKGDDEAMVLDEDFLRAVEYGMPPTAGLGIGIDRLVMLITDSHSIQDVLLFPQMRPEKKILGEEEIEE
ncbi:MAG: lysine--tRNA ligase [Lentisphaeria bacterium]|nr:lysine--tRNA ligase [Lentisphaeria bacterium]